MNTVSSSPRTVKPSTTFLDKLAALVARHVKAYATDFQLDKRAFSQCRPGERVLWLCRKSGTQIFPLTADCPSDPIFWAHWLPQALCVRLITFTGPGVANVRRISAKQSARLARRAAQRPTAQDIRPFGPAPVGDGRAWPVM